jgi:hypothetical protein
VHDQTTSKCHAPSTQSALERPAFPIRLARIVDLGTPPAGTTGNEIAFAEVAYASIIGPEIDGIIGPEINGIIGPELPALASFTIRGTSFRVTILDSAGTTIVDKTFKHYKSTFSTDLEDLRKTIRDPSLVDPKTVRISITY